LLLVPLPCKGTLIIGLFCPANLLVAKIASLNIDGGFITPKSIKSKGCGTSELLKSNLICTSGSTIPSAAAETLS